MYTNIPLQDCKMRLLNFISTHYDDINIFGLYYPELEALLDTVMNESYFRFGELKFHQKRGLGMGHRYSPPAANVYVYSLEVELISSWNSKHPELTIDISEWFRALDDIFSVWKYDLNSLLSFLDFFVTAQNLMSLSVQADRNGVGIGPGKRRCSK